MTHRTETTFASAMTDFDLVVSEPKGRNFNEISTEKFSLPAAGCMVAQWDNSNSWNYVDIISRETATVIGQIITAYLFPLLFVLGAVGNAVSMAVFHKLGLRERINLCLFALAGVDFVVVSYAFALYSESFYRLFSPRSAGPTYGVIFRFILTSLTGLIGFGKLSQFLSAVIAMERCACVVSPLRARKLMKTSTMAGVIALAFVFLVGGMFGVVGRKFTTACAYDPLINATWDIIYVTRFYIENSHILDPIDVFIMSTALPGIFLALVIVTSVVTAVKLWTSFAWRSSTTATTTPRLSTTASASQKEVALTKMLIATSILFIACAAPNFVVQLVSFFVPDLKDGGRYNNLVQVLHLVRLLSTDIQCSLNFIVYYKTGSRYRKTVLDLLACRRHSNKELKNDVFNSGMNTDRTPPSTD